MKPAAVLLVVAALFAALLSLSCSESLSHDLVIVNNSGLEVERVVLGYTGIESRAMVPDFEIDAAVPPGETRTVVLLLDPSSDYYIMEIRNTTAGKFIMWNGSYAGSEHVLLAKGGSSTCTIGNSKAASFAGGNSANPAVYDWGP